MYYFDLCLYKDQKTGKENKKEWIGKTGDEEKFIEVLKNELENDWNRLGLARQTTK